MKIVLCYLQFHKYSFDFGFIFNSKTSDMQFENRTFQRQKLRGGVFFQFESRTGSRLEVSRGRTIPTRFLP